MNRNRLKIVLPLAIFTCLLPNAVQAQSMGGEEISQTISNDPADHGADSSNAPLGAPNNNKPIDLLGDIWKQANCIDATDNGSHCTKDPAATILKLPVADRALAAHR